MNAINSWSALVCISAVICILIELIVPPGKIGKIMNMTLGMFILCIFITPFAQGFNFLDFNFKNKKESEEPPGQFKFLEDVNNQIKSITEENMKAIILGILKDIHIRPKKIEIFMDTDKDNCILMIKCKVYMPKEQGELKEKIRNEIDNKLKIDAEVIEE